LLPLTVLPAVGWDPAPHEPEEMLALCGSTASLRRAPSLPLPPRPMMMMVMMMMMMMTATQRALKEDEVE
jgi:hypothetical protein